MPTVPIPQALEFALQHHEAGRWAEAEVIYRQILGVQPLHAEAHHLLGVIAHQEGREEEAVEWIRRAMELGLGTAAAHSNLGEAYRGLGRLDEAIAAYRAALQRQPDLAAVHYNLGSALQNQGRIDEAAAAFARAGQLRPGHGEAHGNLGACLLQLGQIDEAVAAYRHALRIKPDVSESWFNLGVALTQRGENEEASIAYRRAAQVDPEFAEAHHNLGAALIDGGQWEAAVVAFRRALAIKPDYAAAYYNLGNAFGEQGNLDEAVSAYQRAVELEPGYLEALNNLGNTYKAQGRAEEALAAFQRAVECPGASAGVQSNLISMLHYVPGVHRQRIAAEQARWNRRFSEPMKPVVRFAHDRHPERRLRIGYVSADLRDHTLGRNLRPLFRGHDHASFEIICYAGAARADRLTEEFRLQADQWRNTVRMSDEALAKMIREDGVDILVDLGLHTAGNRLPVLARAPAPVQVSFAGYPASTGVEAIGYRISDRYLESGVSDGVDTKEKVLLIDSFWCYDPCGMEVAVNDLPARAAGAVTFGSLNNFCKINEPVLKLWARILGEAGDSRLILLSPEGSQRQWVRETLQREGVAAERVEFVAPRARKEYLELYHRVDVMLDPFPYNGHTTSLDALWMGVPVVSFAGPQSVSRAGWSQLSNLGLPELAAFSAEEYVKAAAGLARDLPRLAGLRRTLRSRMEASVLMDGARFARGVEEAYREMWRRWCAEAEPV